MRFYETLHQTIEKFNLSAKAICQKSNVRENALSQFRHGKRDLQVDSLERIFYALPPEAKNYFLLQLVFQDMDQHGVAILLNIIADRLKTENTETTESFVSRSVLSLR